MSVRGVHRTPAPDAGYPVFRNSASAWGREGRAAQLFQPVLKLGLPHFSHSLIRAPALVTTRLWQHSQR